MSPPEKRPGSLAGAAKDADDNFVAQKVGQIVDPCAKMPKLTLHVDANRDGKVDDVVEDGWAYGKGKPGAIILCNNDDDDGKRRLDNVTTVIEVGDEPDIAALVIRKTPPNKNFPPGSKAFLEVSSNASIRIFDNRVAGGKEIIGPTTKDIYQLPDPNQAEITLGMEATRYPAEKAPFGGIWIILRVLDPKGQQCSYQQVYVRAAPWSMAHHLDPTEKVYVVKMSDNGTFIADLNRHIAATGVPPAVQIDGASYRWDRWAQDVMELGSSAMPRVGAAAPDASWHLPVVLRTAEDREKRRQGNPRLDWYPQEKILGRNFGFHRTNNPDKDAGSLNSFGNMECSPPVRVLDKTSASTYREYKFGRIMYGHDPDPTRAMHLSVVAFLQAQQIQEPFSIDTSWLAVGHVDEILSFCPVAWASNPFKRFQLVMASPRVALQLFTLLQAQRDSNGRSQGDAAMLTGVSPPPDPAIYDMKTPNQVLANAQFVEDQRWVQTRLDATKGILKQELGLDDADVIELPVLFRREPKNAPQRKHFIAYLPNVVNMLAVTKGDGSAVLCIPKPFGPVLPGIGCFFEASVRAALSTTGNQIEFVDDFHSYHEGAGEVHCGTNSKRRPRTDVWWWEQWVREK